MANIELVINIPEDEYQNILHTGKASFCAVNAIEAGTPLPKGHGNLKDVNEIWRLYNHTDDMDYTMFDALNDTPVIIEADNVESEKENEKNYYRNVTDC